MIIGLVPFALGLAACQTAPYSTEPYPAPVSAPPVDRGEYRAIGTEPFWDLTIGPRMTFTNRGTNASVVETVPPFVAVANGVRTYTSRRLRVKISPIACSDGMSERRFPDTVEVSVDGRLYRGCGAPASFFLTVDDRGNPQMESALPGPETALERTRWRIARINGRAVPRQGTYSIDFDSGRIAAKFGCNTLSAPYTQNGTTLDAGVLASTRMGCFNAALETQGGAILDQVMTVAVTGRNRVTLSSTAGTIDLVRR